MLLEGRVAIVSGVGPGLGRDIALAFAREGADVALAARTEATLKDVAAEVESIGPRALCVPTDIGNEDQCTRLAEEAARELGGIDILVNNAFVQPPFRTVEEAPMDVWRAALEVNVMGSVQVTRAVIPHMRKRGAGSIVFVNSMAAERILPRYAPYAATKSALLAIAKTLALELGRDGIRVNTVSPGYIWGPSLEAYFQHRARKRGVDPKAVYDEVASETALGRIPTSEEIAEAVVFFASDLARAITGQTLHVNAGHWFH